MKLFIPKPNEDWISDRTISEIRSFTRHQVVDDINSADVVWLYARWIYDQLPRNKLLEKTVVTTIHHLVPQKNQTVNEFESFTDAYHVPCIKTELAVMQQTKKPIHRLKYWIDSGTFHFNDNVKPMNEHRLVLMSLQRDTEGDMTFAIKPKVEKGPDTYVKIVNRFSENEAVPFYPGWRRQYIKNSLMSRGVTTDDKLPFENVPSLYNIVSALNGYYLVTSRIEGGPQSVLEAAACKVKILSTDVGIASELLHEKCICGDPNSPDIVDIFEQKLRDDVVTKEIVEYNYDRVMSECDMRKLISKHDDMLESVHNSRIVK